MSDRSDIGLVNTEQGSLEDMLHANSDSWGSSPAPTEVTRRTTIILPVFPGADTETGPKISVLALINGDNLDVTVSTEGDVSSEDEYYQVTDMIKALI